MIRSLQLSLAALVVVLALDVGMARAQFVTVYSAPAPVVAYPSVAYYAPAPVVAYTAPAPVSYYSSAYYYPYAPSYYHSYYAAPTVTYSAPYVAGYTTRTYTGLGIFRPRGVYTSTYFTPPMFR